jgi:hypothetical protein
LQLGRFDLLGERFNERLQFRFALAGIVALRELHENAEIVEPADQRFQRLERKSQPSLFGNDRLRLFLVIPEAGFRLLLADFFQSLLLACVVKESLADE